MPASFRERRVIAALQCVAVLVLIVFLPAALRYRFNFNSLAPGLLISCTLLIPAAGLGLFGKVKSASLANGLLVGGLILLGVTAHLGLSLFQWSADLGRALSSLAALALVLATAPFVYDLVFRTDEEALRDALAIVRVGLLIMVLLALARIQPVSDLASDRPVWPFTEPSHFVLAATPFLMHGCVAGRRLERWFWLGLMSLLVIALQSVSLGVATVIVAACSLALGEIAAFAVLAGLGIAFVDLTYFTDRLDISYGSTNLSALIYLQGIELVQEALSTTHGWGIAFQQLGFAPTNVLATEMIRRVAGGEQNLTDGSFLAVKLGAEFGSLGVVLLGAYLIKLGKVLVDLRLIALRRAESPTGFTFALVTFAALFVEIFVRGIGYFSGSALLALAGMGLVLRVQFVERRGPLRLNHGR
jgi:hypothetical protein